VQSAIAVVCWGGKCGAGLPKMGLLDPHEYAQFSHKLSSLTVQSSTFSGTNKLPIEASYVTLSLT
jgi:hypothetical protein